MTNAALATINFLWSLGGLFTAILRPFPGCATEETRLVVGHLSFHFYFAHGAFLYASVVNLSTNEAHHDLTLVEIEAAARNAAANFKNARANLPEEWVRQMYREWYKAAEAH